VDGTAFFAGIFTVKLMVNKVYLIQSCFYFGREKHFYF